MISRSSRWMVSNPITCCSVMRWASTPRGMECPQHKKTEGAFRPLERGLLRCPSLIPGQINTHGLTDDPMMLLDAMALKAYRILHDKLHQHHRGKEGEDYGRCRG